MLHFKIKPDVGLPILINDDAGQVGVPVFEAFKFDTTSGGSGDTNELALFCFNDDASFKYVTPQVSLSGSDPVLQKSWFKFLDNKYVAGSVPNETEWNTYGIAGTSYLDLDEISEASGTNPERKFWIRCFVPAGISTANLTGLKLKADAVEEAV